jgi:peptidoglycan/xylan/chitin deacetylase (PgdA/CDA1 family)
MKLLLTSLVIAVCGFIAEPLASQAPKQPERQVAITIDDLPAGAANSMTAAAISEMTSKLLGTLRDQKVPAVGFINEKKLYKWGEVDDRIKVLRIVAGLRI